MLNFFKTQKMDQENTTISGDNVTFTNGATTDTFTVSLLNTNEITIQSFEFKQTSDGNFIEVIKRQLPNTNLYVGAWPPPSDVPRVWKEIYGVTTEGTGTRNLQLIRTIEGKVTPAHFVDEDVDFEE